MLPIPKGEEIEINSCGAPQHYQEPCDSSGQKTNLLPWRSIREKRKNDGSRFLTTGKRLSWHHTVAQLPEGTGAGDLTSAKLAQAVWAQITGENLPKPQQCWDLGRFPYSHINMNVMDGFFTICTVSGALLSANEGQINLENSQSISFFLHVSGSVRPMYGFHSVTETTALLGQCHT